MTGLLAEHGAVSKAAFLTFSDDINQTSVGRIMRTFNAAQSDRYDHLHILFQSTGGFVGDGIALYNFFRTSPVEVTLYNVGTVASMATIAFIGAKNRVVSNYGCFMLHKCCMPSVLMTANRAQSVAQSLILDDQRVEAILGVNLALTENQIAIHNVADLWFNAEDSVKAKIANSIGDFCPTFGGQIVHI